jgi:gamma-glutamylaminecyclotransferase
VLYLGYHSAIKMQSVFVYGTLKSGEPNHAWMTDWHHGKFHTIGIGRTVQAYPLIIGTQFNIPFVLDKPGVGHVCHSPFYFY